MKSYVLLLIGAALLCLTACQDDKQKKFYYDYFQNALDVQFPAGTTLADYFDSKKDWVIAVFKLPKDGLDTFISANHFEQPTAEHAMNGRDKLKSAYRNLPALEQQAYREGRGWQAVIDREKGLMWVLLIYAEKDNDVGF